MSAKEKSYMTASVPIEMKIALQEAADRNGRSLAKEITARLAATLIYGGAEETLTALADEREAAFGVLAAFTFRTVEQLTGRDTYEDRYTSEVLAKALEGMVFAFAPEKRDPPPKHLGPSETVGITAAFRVIELYDAAAAKKR